MGSYVVSPQVALLTEHLEHTPIALIDEIINTINLLVTNSLDTVEATFNQNPKLFGYPDGPDGPGSLSPASQHEISNGMHQLETLLGSLIDKNYDKFEIYVLRNVLTVPEGLVGWVRLPHQQGLEFKPSDLPAPSATAATSWFHPTHPTMETFTRLRQKLIASHSLNQTLKTETASNAALISKLKAALTLPTSSTSPESPVPSPLSFLSTSTPSSLQPLPTTAEFITLQISSIRSLLESIQPKVDALHNTMANESSTDDDEPLAPDLQDMTDLDPENPGVSPNEKRNKYIEKMTRRHMQKQRRLKLTNRGEVVGGEYWDGVAAGIGSGTWGQERRRALDEVQALEAIFGTDTADEMDTEKNTTAADPTIAADL